MIRILLLFMLSALFSPHAHAADEPLKTLWSIGSSDNDSAEMALGRDGWENYGNDGFFVAGRSNPKSDWPYVHPGPSDTWAGSREHTFTVVFAIDSIPEEGVCRFTADLIDTHRSAPPELTVSLNGVSFGFSLPHGKSDSSLMGFPAEGREYRFSGAVPVTALREGINQLSITNKNGSWFIYDSIRFEVPAMIQEENVAETVVREIDAPPLLVERDGILRQIVRFSVFNTVRDRKVSVTLNGGERQDIALGMGEQKIEASYPAVDKDTPLSVALTIDGRTVAEKSIVLRPVRKWSVYFLPHSHVDIGYTHLQDEVMHRQWDNYRQAIDLAKKTAGYPENAQFKWNAEVLWPVDGLLRDAPAEIREDFLDAVKNGQVGLDALYGSMLTGLARPEELFEFTSFAGRLRDEYGFTIDTAMITDVPGYVWGMVPALAQSGIRYFNPGPNHMPMLPHQGDRIGYTSEEWGDKPFWWLSQSGQDRVLVWIPTHGYSWFHEWILGAVEKAGAEPILGYIGELEEKGFPYDMVQLRYTIGADNGPPDPGLPDFVRNWNAKYAWPKMIIATTGDMFREFERRYGDRLPEYRGDFTPYWEDGAASTAKATALNRNAAERLVQARTLWAMNDPENCPDAEFDEAWRNVILFTEHTWGAHNSISEPESDFVKGQWNVKKSFALKADEMSRGLLKRAVSENGAQSGATAAVDIYNTSSWTRSGLVMLPETMKLSGGKVQDENGSEVLSQFDHAGNLLILAKDIPPFGSKRYHIGTGETSRDGNAAVRGNSLSNGTLTVAIDPSTGTVSSLKNESGIDCAFDNNGLNGYQYLPGRNPKDAVPSGKTTLTVIDNGPLFVTVEAVSEAPGARSLKRRYRLAHGLDYLEIVNTVDKEPVKDKESVHFAWPFDVPGGEVRYDIAWGIVRPDKDQLPGGNRNFFSIQRWADVSSDSRGVTLASVDAPLIELAEMNAEAWNLEANRPWLKKAPETQTIFSYVMNNYWHTNYKAYQEGPVTFRYALRPHGPFDPAETKRFGIEMSQPLIAVRAAKDMPDKKAPFIFDSDDGVLVSSVTPLDKGNAFMVRLFNASENAGNVTMPAGCKAWMGTPSGKRVKEISGALRLKAYETAAVIVE